MELKKGILKVIAKTGGIKLENEDDWINPTKNFKDYILKNIEMLKKWKGQLIYLEMSDSGGTYKGIGPVQSHQKNNRSDTLFIKNISTEILSYDDRMVVFAKVELSSGICVKSHGEVLKDSSFEMAENRAVERALRFATKKDVNSLLKFLETPKRDTVQPVDIPVDIENL